MRISNFKFQIFNSLLPALFVTTFAFAQEPAPQPKSYSDPAEVRKQLDEILAQPEFRRLRLKTQQSPEQAEKPLSDADLPDWPTLLQQAEQADRMLAEVEPRRTHAAS